MASANGGGGEGDDADEDDGILREGAAAATTGTIIGAVPNYDGDALARVVLADAWFYGDKPELAKILKQERERALTRDATIRQVRQMYPQKSGEKNSLESLSDAIGARFGRIKQYFAGGAPSLEQLLIEREVFALDDDDKEVRLFFDRRVAGYGLPTPRGVFDALAYGNEVSPRSYRLCYVTGSSGSGKTFFSLHYLRNVRNDDKLPSVTMYIKPAGFYQQVDFSSSDAPQRLVRLVQKRFASWVDAKLKRQWLASDGPLRMHVCFVFDDAESLALGGFFDNTSMVLQLLAALDYAEFAESFAVVVSGTRVQGRAFDSQSEALTFRMQPWRRGDLIEVLEKNKESFLLKPEDSVIPLADAIASVALLNALTFNGRTTFYLMKAIQSSMIQLKNVAEINWITQLNALSPEIAALVVRRYSDDNSLRDLDGAGRKRVGAWVLGWLSRLKTYRIELPEFDGLSQAERLTALSLIEQNAKNRESLRYGEIFSSTVTPALALVLLDLIGALPGALLGWKGAEEVAALYTSRQWVLREWRNHARRLNKVQKRFVPDRDLCTLDQFEKRLAEKGDTAAEDYNRQRIKLERQFGALLGALRLYRPSCQIQSPGTPRVLIPIVPKRSILLYGAGGSFAAVVAPYTLVLSKYGADRRRPASVSLPDALGECALLRGCADARALRGLLAVWRGGLPAAVAAAAADEDDTGGGGGWIQGGWATADDRQRWLQRQRQRSASFPENLLSRPEPSAGVSYLEVPPGGPADAALPGLPEVLDVSFVVATDADRIDVALAQDGASRPRRLAVSRKVLDPASLEVDAGRLPDPESRRAWASFLAGVREGVSVKFLFTNPS
jgi:hypothetical protein